jgi:hypothetical protein
MARIAAMVGAACLWPAAGFADKAAVPTNPPASASLAAACAKTTCRPAEQRLQLRTADDAIAYVKTAKAPYVDENGNVSLYAGETIEISFPDRNDLSHPTFVRTLDKIDLEGIKGYHLDAPPSDPAMPAILSLQLHQEESKPSMALVLRNETGIALKYDVTMFVPTPQGMRATHTSTCPLLPGIMGDESWPHPIAMIMLSNFRKTDPGQMVCD